MPYDTPVAYDDTFDVIHDTPTPLNLQPDIEDPQPGVTATIYSVTRPVDGGTVVITSGSTLTYTPPTHWTGTDSFQYTITNGHVTSQPATVTISVTETVPEAFDDIIGEQPSYNWTSGKWTVSGQMDGQDPDGVALTYSVASPPPGLSFSRNTGSFTMTWTGSQNSFVFPSFTFTCSDGIASSNVATCSSPGNEPLYGQYDAPASVVAARISIGRSAAPMRGPIRCWRDRSTAI